MAGLQIRAKLQDFRQHGLIDGKAHLHVATFHAEARLEITARKVTRQHGTDRMFSRFQPLRKTQPQIQPLAVDGPYFPDDARFSALHGVLHGMACKSGHALERHASVPYSHSRHPRIYPKTRPKPVLVRDRFRHNLRIATG